MARSNDPNSASSQFYICLAPKPDLDGKYTVFGHVVEGMDAVDAIAGVPTGPADRPLEDVVIERVTVSADGQTVYPPAEGAASDSTDSADAAADDEAAAAEDPEKSE